MVTNMKKKILVIALSSLVASPTFAFLKSNKEEAPVEKVPVQVEQVKPTPVKESVKKEPIIQPKAVPAVKAEPVLIAKPTPKPVPKRVNYTQVIDGLYESALLDVDRLRLTKPSGNSAFDKYKRIEKIIAEHRKDTPVSERKNNQNSMIDLRNRIAMKYVFLADNKMKKGELGAAEVYLQRSWDVVHSTEAKAAFARLIDFRNEESKRLAKLDEKPVVEPKAEEIEEPEDDSFISQRENEDGSTRLHINVSGAAKSVGNAICFWCDDEDTTEAEDTETN